MFLYRCHFYPVEALPLQDIKHKLCTASLVSVRDEMSTAFSDRIGFLGVEIPPPINIPQDSEILARADAQGLCHIRVSRGEEEKSYIEVHILAPDDDTGSQLMDVCGVPWRRKQRSPRNDARGPTRSKSG